MAENSDGAFARVRQADEASERCGLAGAVAAQKRDDLPFMHLEADAVQNVALAIIGVQVLGLQHDRVAHAALPK
jgi:hypothetical protein